MAQTVYDPPVATYIPLQTITLGSAASSVTFASIPQTYRDLIVVIDGETTASCRPQLRFNGDTGSNYSYVQMAGGGAYSNSGSGTALEAVHEYAVTGRFSLTWQILDASASDRHKSVLMRAGQLPPNGDKIHATAGRWANNTAVTSVTLLTNQNAYASSTTFSLYGIEA
jgi:hypothetical protein